jgi:hypothetical protein
MRLFSSLKIPPTCCHRSLLFCENRAGSKDVFRATSALNDWSKGNGVPIAAQPPWRW